MRTEVLKKQKEEVSYLSGYLGKIDGEKKN